MRIYLAGEGHDYVWRDTESYDFCRLKSFYYVKDKDMQDVQRFSSYMLDSGAYSTFKDPATAKHVDWDAYVKGYIACIRKYNIKLFFELDIDAVIGLNKVEYYRQQVADATGIMPIVVWHSKRGWAYFERMCEQYDYVALGTTLANAQGVAIRKNPLVLQKFIATAHRAGAKIHGLGFTSLKYLPLLRFDSVDSTSWLGARYGFIYCFTGNNIKQLRKPPGTKLRTREVMRNNFIQWYKFAKYAEAHL